MVTATIRKREDMESCSCTCTGHHFFQILKYKGKGKHEVKHASVALLESQLVREWD